MASALLNAPAKLNLFLHILGRRADGYHELQTAFDLIDWVDQVELTSNDTGQVRREGEVAGLRPGQPDLCEQAAHLLQQHCAIHAGVDIVVRKQIPVGAGLGGGSSNAAAVLLGLNQLWNCRLSRDELATLGLQLGADVPVFVHGHPAIGEGVGERLSPLQLPPRCYLVMVPDCHISTAEVFADPGLTRSSRPITIADFRAGAGGNDCQEAVLRRWSEVAELMREMQALGAARMTGTGSALFVPCTDPDQATAAAQRIVSRLEQPIRWRVCAGLDESPAVQLAAQSAH